jgi:transcriptional regulator with XRE-family HTH domain
VTADGRLNHTERRLNQAEAQRAIQSLYDALGDSIRQARQGRGVTQADLARAAGITRTSLTNIEHGRQRPPLHVIVALAQALGIEACVLIDGDTIPVLASALPTSTKLLKATLLAAQDHIGAVLAQLPEDR